jgi:hypothetical protein
VDRQNAEGQTEHPRPGAADHSEGQGERTETPEADNTERTEPRQTVARSLTPIEAKSPQDVSATPGPSGDIPARWPTRQLVASVKTTPP